MITQKILLIRYKMMPGDKSVKNRIFLIPHIFPDFVRASRFFNFPEVPEVKNRGNRENCLKTGIFVVPPLASFYRKDNENIPSKTYFKIVRTQLFFLSKI